MTHPRQQGDPTAEPKAVVDDEHLSLAGTLRAGTTYDVLLNGTHVWSLEPGRDTTSEGGRLVARWPKALLPHLSGRAEVVVRDHVTGELAGSGSHVFGGDDSREVSVTDSAGRPLLLDKWGRLIRPMSSEDTAVIDELMDEVVRLIDVLSDVAGVPTYVCYGTLLGAVRNGRIIGHDNDVDIAYVSEHLHPVDVVREAYRIERILLQEGYLVRRGSGVRINVRFRLSDGSMRRVDVFTSHWVEGVLYIPSDTGFRLPRETILPLGTVELMGREVPAPADPERLLAATYGESWRVPDPSFQYVRSEPLARRLAGWFGGLVAHRKHWDSFNAKSRRRVPRRPTPFARWVAQRHPSDRLLVDLGTGTGRDARWFATKHGRRVLGIDYCIGPVTLGNRHSRANDLPATYELLNLYDTREVLVLGTRLSREPEPVDLYARFTMHDLEEPGRENIVRLASMSLRRGGFLFLEFRTLRDRRRRHTFGDHTRHYLRPRDVVRMIEQAGGEVVEQTGGTGLAPFKGEDPYIHRVVARWSGDPDPATAPAAE